MRFLKPLLASLLGIFLVVFPVLAIDFPRPTGFVNDFAEILSPQFRQSLEEDLEKFTEETTAEITVVTIKSLEDENLEDYAVRLFEDWQIGKKGKDNGILVLIAQEERKIKIEVGYGLEPIITDGRAGRIIREQMQDSFRQDNYDQGVRLAVEKIEEYILSGEPPPEVDQTGGKELPLVLFLIFGFLLFIYSLAFLARSKSYWAGGVVGAILGAILGSIIGTLMAALFSAASLGLFGLLLDYILSKNYKKLKKKGKSTGFFSSRGGFSSGGGGGGFGGFGGGSSGGGGASGGW
ncbi:MAG TPA: TPM domain-containing protein [Candidatus Bathyarchaeia archaeon]|nr:TPM domain-containing protein [Candidatus Bathyarchaeia archaeon]